MTPDQEPDALREQAPPYAPPPETQRLIDELYREELLALRRKVQGAEQPDTIRAMASLSISYYAAGRKDEALKMREEALALCRSVLGNVHEDSLQAMGGLAISYDDVGRKEEAQNLRNVVNATRAKNKAAAELINKSTSNPTP